MGSKKEQSIIYDKDHPNGCLKTVADEHNSPATALLSEKCPKTTEFKRSDIRSTLL
jgi:hypothetical protein